MNEMLRFWKKDFTNKLILIHTFLLFVAVAAFVLYLFLLPQGKSFGGFLGRVFPTSTTEPEVIMTEVAEQAILKMYYATASVEPTITTQPLVEIFVTSTRPATGFTGLVTGTPQPTIEATPTATLAAVAAQVTPTSAAVGQTPAPTAMAAAGLSCLPKTTPETGRVIDVMSGNEIKVLIGDYAYVVRYIGVSEENDLGFSTMATNINGSITFGKDVLLYKDAQDVDISGRYLRWVVVDGKMPAIALLEQGLLTTFNPSPNDSCYTLLVDAETKAKNEKLGVWLTK